ncbi:MAG: energy transducer TonB [Rhodocyclaceae bacterium]|nr:energy transducer TonB [Rhodocyclaceae bacterium]
MTPSQSCRPIHAACGGDRGVLSVPGPAAPRISSAGLIAVLLLHGGVFWLLLQMNFIKLPAALNELTVHLIRPPEEVKPPKPPPSPLPVEKRPVPVQQPVQLAAPEASPAPPSMIAVPPAPTFIAPLVPIAPIASPPAPPAPVQTVQPRFDADYLDNPKPSYPALSRRMGEEGRVVLRVHVRESGIPDEVQVHKSSGAQRLDQAAQDTVRRWKFIPARRGTEAVAAWVLVPIVFTLKE